MGMSKSVCTKCGNEFEREAKKEWGANAPGKQRRFCSKQCSGRYWNDVLNAQRKTRPLLSRPCETCGNGFIPKRHRKARFCSRKCSDKSKWSVEHPKEQRVLVCSHCSKDFSVLGGGKRKFCTPRCYRNHWTKHWRKTHPHYRKERDRKHKWGGNWIAALQRDSFSCQICGHVGTVDDLKGLIVHHLDGQGDQHGKNHALDNLQTLCGRCHATLHHGTLLVRKEGKLFVKFGEKYLEVNESKGE